MLEAEDSKTRRADPASSSERARDSPSRLSITDSHTDEAKLEAAANLLRGRPEVPRALWRVRLEGFLESITVQVVMSLITIYALFSDDLRLLAFTKPADVTFYSLSTAALALFGLEIILASIAKEDYFNSFFFWLDIISTASLVGDIAWIVPEESSAGEQATDIGKQARAGRAARVMRLIRLIRLMRISKLYKEAKKAREKKPPTHPSGIKRSLTPNKAATIFPAECVPEPTSPHQSQPLPVEDSSSARPRLLSNIPLKPAEENPIEHVQESKISKLLMDLTTQRVIVLILVLTFILPMLQLESYFDAPFAAVYAVKALAEARSNMTLVEFQPLCNTLRNSLSSDTYYPLVQMTGPSDRPCDFGGPRDDLRASEMMICEKDGYTVVTDMRANTQLTAGLGIGRTVFICVLLAAGAIIFSNVTTSLVLYPLESMIEKVNLLAHNPMAVCLATSEEEFGIYSLRGKLEQKDAKEHYETQFLEGLIIKIAQLLAVEFGEAGTRIVSSNLETSDFLNPMVPGVRMHAIFGFCIINSFAETTKALQKDILVYLNQIAETVHATIDKYLGSTNKNIGDAFLVLWKFEDGDAETTPNGVVTRSSRATTLVDFALFAYLKIIAKLNKLVHILDFAKLPAIVRDMPGYQLKMGFGLHVGWGIEGAIGSVHKIDASYLSPNVNISARLEAATKQYGVPLLISGQVYNLLSPTVQKYCREIDVVTVKGSKIPLKLFTVDLDVHAVERKDCKYASVIPGERKAKRLTKRKQFHAEVKDGTKTSRVCYETDKDLQRMRAGVNPTFIKQFQDGYTNYIAGNWNQAVENLNKAEVLCPTDGPTKTLLAYMSSKNNIPPADWKGWRELTEK